MSSQNSEFTLNTEYIVEIRFKPNPEILDYRGKWAKEISELLRLSHWGVTENRIDVFNDDDKTIQGFLSFRNMGFIIKNNPDSSNLYNKTYSLLQFVFNQREIFSPLYVERIGVRFKYAIPFLITFEELLAKSLNRVHAISPNITSLYDAEIIDIGSPINLRTKNGYVNLSMGPMKKEQLKGFFNPLVNPSEVSYYLDLDYWITPKATKTKQEIAEIVKYYIHQNYSFYDSFIKIMMEE